MTQELDALVQLSTTRGRQPRGINLVKVPMTDAREVIPGEVI